MNDFLNRLIHSVKVQATVFLTLLCLALFWQLRWYGFRPSYVIPDILSLFLLGLLCISLIDVIQRYYNSSKAFNSSNSALLILLVGFVTGSNYVLSGVFSGWSFSYLETVRSGFLFRLSAIALFFAFVHLRFWSHKRLERDEKMKQLAVENERALVKIEMNSIQQQLKPHFLFNSLNSINALTMTNPEEAQRMVHLLSEFMRGSVKEQNKTVTLDEEIRHLQLYTDIERVRFGDRLQVDYQVDEDVLECTLPFLILQPIMENAIKYGLYGNTEQISITIAAEKTEDYLHISVSNPFDTITQKTNKGTGFGIRSVERKLLLIYKRSNLLTTKTDEATFTATLQIPQS